MHAAFRSLSAAIAWVALATTSSAQPADPSPGTATSPGVRVDGLAAVVGGLTPGPEAEPILRSDVELRARIAWAGEHESVLPLEPLPDALLHSALQQMIGEVLIAREARRVRVAAPSDSQVAEELRRLQRAAGGADRLSRVMHAMGASMQELDEVARRRVRVAAFLKANLEGATVVTDADVERFLQRREHDLHVEDPEIVRQRARAQLARQALDRAVRRWVRVLKGRVPVRIYVAWGGAKPR